MPQTRANSDFMTTREAARQLGVSLSTVQGWVENGLLKAWKTPGGHRRIPNTEVEKIRDRQTREMNPDINPDINPGMNPGMNLEINQQTNPAEKPRVLIVEDEQAQQELYKLQFANLDLPIELHIAENGFQGLVMFGRLEPGLIITDLSMPEMDGFKMINELVSLGLSSDAIIVVTGLSMQEIQASEQLPAGITVLSKPVELAEIKAAVSEKISLTR